MSWIIDEAQRADPARDRVILENPTVVRELDELLVETFYPPVRRALQATGYGYSSIDVGAIPMERSRARTMFDLHAL